MTPQTRRHYSGSVITAVVLGALVAGAVYRYWPSDERSIRRHLSNLAEALSLPADESQALRLTRFAALREYFAPEVTIQSGDRVISSRDALFAWLGQLTPPPEGVVVHFQNVEVDVAPDAGTAQVRLTAAVVSREFPGKEPTEDVRTANVKMAKRAGDWVIVDVVASLPQ